MATDPGYGRSSSGDYNAIIAWDTNAVMRKCEDLAEVIEQLVQSGMNNNSNSNNNNVHQVAEIYVHRNHINIKPASWRGRGL